MESEDFYQQLVAIAELAPHERRRSLLDLHTRVYYEYLDALGQITIRGASRNVPDGRSVAQVVGHIIEWDRATLMSLGEILSGVEWPRLMSRSLNIDRDGTVREFESIDDFNAHYAGTYENLDWDLIKACAQEVATDFLHLVEAPSVLTPDRLERTRLFDHYRLPTGATLNLPCGWYLWMVTIEHEGVEHAEDLRIGRSG